MDYYKKNNNKKHLTLINPVNLMKKQKNLKKINI